MRAVFRSILLAITAVAVASTSVDAGAFYGARAALMRAAPTALPLTPGQQATLAKLRTAAAAAAISNPVSNADMATPPTLSFAATTNASLTVHANYLDNPGSFRASPGHRYVKTSGKRLYIGTSNFSPNNGGNLGSQVGLVATDFSPNIQNDGENMLNTTLDFVTASPVVEMSLGVSAANTPYRLIVDGQYASRTGFQATAAYTTITMNVPPADGVAYRITLEAQFSAEFIGNVSVQPGYTITAPTDPTVTQAVSGDSYGEAINHGTVSSSNPYQAWANWAAVFGRLVGVNGQRNADVGGTGYWNQVGGRTGSRNDVLGQMAYWSAEGTLDQVVIAAGFNDTGQDPDADITARALAVWQKARADQPNALIIVMGIWGGNNPNYTFSSVRIGTEQALINKFNAWGDPFSMFIPVSTDPVPWAFGVADDNTHPSPAGQLYNGNRANAPYRAKLATFH